MEPPNIDRLRAEEIDRRARDRVRWIRFSLVPMLFVFIVVFVGSTVVVVALNRQNTANEMVLRHLTENTDKIVSTVVALSGASRERQIELAQRQIAILCVQAILPANRTKKNVARCLRNLPHGLGA